ADRDLLGRLPPELEPDRGNHLFEPRLLNPFCNQPLPETQPLRAASDQAQVPTGLRKQALDDFLIKIMTVSHDDGVGFFLVPARLIPDLGPVAREADGLGGQALGFQPLGAIGDEVNRKRSARESPANRLSNMTGPEEIKTRARVERLDHEIDHSPAA